MIVCVCVCVVCVCVCCVAVLALKFNFSAVTNAEKARMWSYMADDIDIYSNSFGPENSGFVVDGPNRVLNLSLATAVQQVRCL